MVVFQEVRLNCICNTITGEMSTSSTSPMQIEAPDAEFIPTEGQSESSAEVEPSLALNNTSPDNPPSEHLAEDGKVDTVVQSPFKTKGSSTDQPDAATPDGNVTSGNTSKRFT